MSPNEIFMIGFLSGIFAGWVIIGIVWVSRNQPEGPRQCSSRMVEREVKVKEQEIALVEVENGR
jgi:uncharacterized membrane protein YciS (DUF1049 family)